MTAAIPAQRLGETFDDLQAPEVWAIVQRVQAGDTAAYADIWIRYRGNIYRYIHKRVANHAVTEDLTATVFEKGLRRIDSFTWQGRDFGAWLMTIARNLTVDHVKSAYNRLEIQASDLNNLDSVDEDLAANPEPTVVTHTQHQAILTAMKELTNAQQTVVSCRLLLGYSVRETAELLGAQEGAIKALQYRAIQHLRTALGPGFDERVPEARPLR